MKILDYILKLFGVEIKSKCTYLFLFLFLLFLLFFLSLKNCLILKTNIHLYFKFITDKASKNLSLAKTFRIDYKYQYDEDIYNIEYVAYTFNNVVSDILAWLFPKNRDDQMISNYINHQSNDLDAEDI